MPNLFDPCEKPKNPKVSEIAVETWPGTVCELMENDHREDDIGGPSKESSAVAAGATMYHVLHDERIIWRDQVMEA
jgi:hypothetical protein